MKDPQCLLNTVFAFPPNRKTLGGTAYFLPQPPASEAPSDPPRNILVDCPPWTLETFDFLQKHGGVQWLFLTHRTAIADVGTIQSALGCTVVVQEQEAYLLPEVPQLQTFQREITLSDRPDHTLLGLWTPGHSPGSACLYWSGLAQSMPDPSTTAAGSTSVAASDTPTQSSPRGILFSGRHLLPTPTGDLAPIRSSKTFHWPRQCRSVQGLADRFTVDTLTHLCPGANTGFLRGQGYVDRAYERLVSGIPG